MEILNSAQRFVLQDGSLKFSYTHVLLRLGRVIYSGQSHARRNGNDFSMDDITNLQPIPYESYMPPLPPDCTVVADAKDYYIKSPNLMSFDPGADLTIFILQELEVGEALRRHPHPNLAAYHGCVVSDERISGLCFERYPESLMTKVNPGNLGKNALLRSAKNQEARANAARYLPGIKQGIQHLHSLGWIHNDLNPSNIMITEKDIPVIIDFDSVRSPGMGLDQTKRTHGWFDPRVSVAQASNDLDALAELQVWLCGQSADDFRFKE